MIIPFVILFVAACIIPDEDSDLGSRTWIPTAAGRLSSPADIYSIHAGVPDDRHLVVVDEGTATIYTIADNIGQHGNAATLSSSLLRQQGPHGINREYDLPLRRVESCCHGPTGQLFGIADGEPFIWDFESGVVRFLNRGLGGSKTEKLWYNPNNRVISFCNEIREISVIDPNENRLINRFVWTDSVLGISTIDSTETATVAGDLIGNVVLFSTGCPPVTVRIEKTPEGLSAKLLPSTFLVKVWLVDYVTIVVLMASPDGLSFETWCYDAHVQKKWILSGTTKSSSLELRGIQYETQSPKSLCFSKDSIKSIDVVGRAYETHVRLKTFPEVSQSVLSKVSISPSGQLIVSFGADGAVVVWRHQLQQEE